MNIGVPKERRPDEFRVGLPPAGVQLFTQHGHTVYVEREAGKGAGFRDEDYERAGAHIVYSQEEVFGRADLLLKFTRPLISELEMMQEGLTLAGFLHLAAARQDKIDLILKKKITAIAFEEVEQDNGFRPILSQLSQVGGQMAVQVAARLLQNDHGGRGILLGGVSGVPSAEVVILGAGTVGQTAAVAFGEAGAQVTVLDIDLQKLQVLQSMSSFTFVTMLSTPPNIQMACRFADVLICAVLVPGERAPILVTRDMVAQMKPQAVVIDMSIDHGGCLETSRPTTHRSPTYLEHEVIHYCVPNMSGVLGRTATHALYIGAHRYLQAISENGLENAIASHPALERSLNTLKGEIVHMKRAISPLEGGA